MSFVNALPAEMRDDYKKLVVSILEWSEAGQKMAELMLPGITEERNKAKADEARGKKRKREGVTPPNPYTLYNSKVLRSINEYGKAQVGYNVNKSAIAISAEYYDKFLKDKLSKALLTKPTDEPITTWFDGYWESLMPRPTAKEIYKKTEKGKAVLKQVNPSHKKQPATPSASYSSSSSSSSTSEETRRRRAEKEARKSAKKAKKSGAGRIEKVVSGKKGNVAINF